MVSRAGLVKAAADSQKEWSEKLHSEGVRRAWRLRCQYLGQVSVCFWLVSADFRRKCSQQLDVLSGVLRQARRQMGQNIPS